MLILSTPTSLSSTNWIENYRSQLVRVFEPSLQSFKKKRMASRDPFLDKFLNGLDCYYLNAFTPKLYA